MNKKTIKLTESDLHRIIKESVNRILRESNDLPYLSDNDIHKQYEGFEIDEFHIEPIEHRFHKKSDPNRFGWECGFMIYFPNVDHPDFDDSKWENVSVDDEKGERMGFDGWYPDDIRRQLVEMVRAEIKKHWPEMEALKKKKQQEDEEEEEKMRQQELMLQQYALKIGRRI